jgi:hypothetical protein
LYGHAWIKLIKMKNHKKFNRINENRKGLSGPALIGTFILVFLMVFGLIALYSKVMKGGTKVLECKTNGGDCVAGTCDFATQIPALSDKAAGCKSGELCCINITKSKPADPKCANLTVGEGCGKVMFCDAALQCVTKCEFCTNNFWTVEGRKVCGTENNNNPIFETNDGIGKKLSCNCTQKQCTDKGTNSCISGFCPRAAAETTAKDYACCIS